MKNNILYFLLGVMLVITVSAKNDRKETKKIISGTYVDSGDGYKLYKHRVNGTWVYVAKSTNSYPVSVTSQ